MTDKWKQLKRWPGWVVLGVVAVALLAFGSVRENGPRTSEERVEEISKQLACPICDGESVFESRNTASVAIRVQIKADVSAGAMSDDDIISKVAQVYGARVLLVPQSTGIDALVWALPVAALVCAVAGLIVVFRRWKRAADTVPTADDRALVEAALREGLDES